MKKDLRERLGKEWLVFDGGTGTILQARGLQGGELPELAAEGKTPLHFANAQKEYLGTIAAADVLKADSEAAVVCPCCQTIMMEAILEFASSRVMFSFRLTRYIVLWYYDYIEKENCDG